MKLLNTNQHYSCNQPLGLGTHITAPHRPQYCAISYIPPTSLKGALCAYVIRNSFLIIKLF